MANTMRGQAQLVDADGQVADRRRTAAAGLASETIEEPIPGTEARLVITVPRADRAFLRIFNLTLLVAGLLAIVAVVAVALCSPRA